VSPVKTLLAFTATIRVFYTEVAGKKAVAAFSKAVLNSRARDTFAGDTRFVFSNFPAHVEHITSL
jgi:predicted lysophospholipase L1 biosynthesis ABC-type transport system permease subunit